MSSDYFKRIFEYHYDINERTFEQLIRIANLKSTKAFKLYCHCLNAHQIWNARIEGKENWAAFDMHPVDRCSVINHQNHKDSLGILDEIPLSKTISYQNSKGRSFKNTVVDIFYHIVNHHSHHRGQIMSEIRRNGLEPIATDYIFYQRH